MTVEVRARIIVNGRHEGTESVILLPELSDPRLAELRAENAELRLVNARLSSANDRLRRPRSWLARLLG